MSWRGLSILQESRMTHQSLSPLIPYAMVKIRKRRDREGLLGLMAIEPTTNVVAFLWPTGEFKFAALQSDEVYLAFGDAKEAKEGNAPPSVEWLGGLAAVFDSHWGEMTVLEISQYEVAAQATINAARKTLMMAALSALPDDEADGGTGG